MGIFYRTFLYQGKLETSTPIEIYDSQYTLTLENAIVVYDPDKFLMLSNMDPIIEPHERTQGYVSKDDIERLLLKHHPEFAKSFDYESGEVYICETMWTSYDFPIRERMLVNLPVT